MFEKLVKIKIKIKIDYFKHCKNELNMNQKMKKI